MALIKNPYVARLEKGEFSEINWEHLTSANDICSCNNAIQIKTSQLQIPYKKVIDEFLISHFALRTFSPASLSTIALKMSEAKQHEKCYLVGTMFAKVWVLAVGDRYYTI